MFLSKDEELYEINESYIGERHKSHLKPLVNIQGFSKGQLTTKEEKSRRRILNRKREYPRL